jgi:hypothetical protein
MLSSTIVVIGLIVITAALCVVIEMRSRKQGAKAASLDKDEAA